MGVKEELGKKIKRMRLNRGLTQEQLAEAVDISQRTLSGIEIGENFVTAETLDKIIKALNTTTEELFATNHLKKEQELLQEIQQNTLFIAKNPTKLDILYNVTKSLMKVSPKPLKTNTLAGPCWTSQEDVCLEVTLQKQKVMH